MYTKNGVIDRFDNNKAIIKTNDGQTIMWEADNLPPNLSAGDAVIIEVKDKDSADQSQQELAKKILHEIFNTETEDKKEIL